MNSLQIRRRRPELSSESKILKELGWVEKEKDANCGLHPLIHTPLGFAQAQDVGKKKVEPKTPHLLSLNQDIVALPQETKVCIKLCNL